MPKFNVNFSDSTYESLTDMSRRLDQPMAEVLREALSIYGWLIREVSKGSTLMIQRGDKPPTELLLPYLEQLRSDAELSGQEEHPVRSRVASRRRRPGTPA